MSRREIFRWREWADPIAPATREVLTSQPGADEAYPAAATASPVPGRPPVLFVPGLGHGAWSFAEHWLEHTAERGYPAYAMSLRGHGASAATARPSLRAYTHDVVQVAARLPRQAVLVGHGVGALAVAGALARYPARAGVLVAPVFGGVSTALTAAWRNPPGTVAGAVGAALRLRRGQLFGRELATATGRELSTRVRPVRAPRVTFRLLATQDPQPPVGDPPMLVVGSPDDRVVPAGSLLAVARRYGTVPQLFPGLGHDLMLDARWQEPLDAILDWLDKSV